MSAASSPRYVAAAIILHWAIAAAILFMIPLGWWMGDALHDPSTQAKAIAAYQVHKSIGLTVLALSLARLALRFAFPPPPLPEAMKPWERKLAVATHWIFYGLMIGLPVTGWIYVSTQWSVERNAPLSVPTLWFGQFEVPHLLGLGGLPNALRATIAVLAEFTHSKLAWAAILFAVMHAGAALKHHFLDRDDILTRMVPGLRPLGAPKAAAKFEPIRFGILLAGGVAFAAAMFVVINLLTAQPRAPTPPVQAVQNEAPPPQVDEPASVAAPAAIVRAASDAWTVNASRSVIGFSGAHAGAPFQGAFSRWSADIRFDPSDLAHARARVILQMASAADGNALHDSTLPQPEWFNVAQYPTAEFISTDIRQVARDQYTAHGELRIKDKRLPVVLPFTLTINGDEAIMNGALSIARADADLGQQSDPGGDWVSPTIDVTVRVVAHRSP